MKKTIATFLAVAASLALVAGIVEDTKSKPVLVASAQNSIIILSLIGGLRSFDLIWAMTGGGPGFATDVMASVIYKQYAYGFYGLSTAGNVIMLILIFVVMWFFMIRPQRKQQKELQQFRSSLKKGDKVVTVGGIYGEIVEVNEKTALIKVDGDTKLRVDKNGLVKDYSESQQQ